VEELFERFEAASEKALKLKRKLVDGMIAALSQHATIEEEFFYPAVREAFSKDDEGMVLEALEEHHIVKWTLNELLDLPADAERFDAKVTVLMESVRHHVKEEEGDLFPKVRKVMSAADLKMLGAQLVLAKKGAPTRPHPRSPDSPPGNLVAAPMAAVMDKGRDWLKSIAGRRAGAKAKGRPAEQLH
jgi:hemerythrin superfamily protein